jgi:hypothetical protein
MTSNVRIELTYSILERAMQDYQEMLSKTGATHLGGELITTASYKTIST